MSSDIGDDFFDNIDSLLDEVENQFELQEEEAAAENTDEPMIIESPTDSDQSNAQKKMIFEIESVQDATDDVIDESELIFPPMPEQDPVQTTSTQESLFHIKSDSVSAKPTQSEDTVKDESDLVFPDLPNNDTSQGSSNRRRSLFLDNFSRNQPVVQAEEEKEQSDLVFPDLNTPEESLPEQSDLVFPEMPAPDDNKQQISSDLEFPPMNAPEKKSEESDLVFPDLPDETETKKEAQATVENERSAFSVGRKLSIVNFSAIGGIAKPALVREDQQANMTMPLVDRTQAPLLPARMRHSMQNDDKNGFPASPLCSEAASESESVQKNDDDVIVIGESENEMLAMKQLIQYPAEENTHELRTEKNPEVTLFKTFPTQLGSSSPRESPKKDLPQPAVTARHETFPSESSEIEDVQKQQPKILIPKQDNRTKSEELHCNRTEEKVIDFSKRNAPEEQLSSVTLQLVSEPYVNSQATKAPEVQKMSIEIGITASLDRAISSFMRMFHNEFGAMMRHGALFDYDEAVDTFVEDLEKQVNHEIERSHTPSSPIRRTFETKIKNLFDTTQSEVTAMLDYHTSGNESRNTKRIHDMKALEQQISSLSDQFKENSRDAIRCISEEAKFSVFSKSQNEADAMQRAVQFRHLQLTKLDLETQLNRKIHEQEEIDLEITKIRNRIHEFAIQQSQTHMHTSSKDVIALSREMANLEADLMKDDLYTSICNSTDFLNRERRQLHKEFDDLHATIASLKKKKKQKHKQPKEVDSEDLERVLSDARRNIKDVKEIRRKAFL